MPTASIALVTCAALPELEPDDQLLLTALRERGADAVPAVWSDPDVDWDAFDLVVIRSPWDYTEALPEFLAWADSVPNLANPAAVVRWNTDKRYLAELAAAGVPSVPTTFLAAGDVPADGVDLVALAPTSGRIVIKPSVGAGSKGAGVYDVRADAERALAQQHVSALLADGATVMVQPYLEAVDDAGETAVMVVGGEVSHAIRKGPMLRGPATEVEGLYVSEEISRREPSAAELDMAQRVLAALPAQWRSLLYARVDLVPDAEGNATLMELELTEPSLFLGFDERAAGRLADAALALVPTDQP